MATRVLVIGDSMSLAHVGRALCVARRLLGEGAEVVFATGRYHQAIARQAGFDPREVFCVPPADAHAAIRRGSHIFDPRTLRRYVQSDLEIIERERPDLVIGDMRLSLNISCELAGVEYWSVLSGYLTHYYAAPQSPPRTFPLVRLLGPTIARRLFARLKALMTRYYGANFRRYRRRLGLAPVRDVFDVIASPHRNLIADLPRFVPCADLPAHFGYIGPQIWEPTVPDPPWLSQIDTEQPCAYVSMGSTGDARTTRRVMGLLRERGWQVMATIAESVPAPAGVFRAELARGSVLLGKSQVIVCHGGSGTIYQAISQGVPVIGIATFHDQEINLERVEALQWGRALDPLGWQDTDLFAAIDQVRAAPYVAEVSRGRGEILEFMGRTGCKPLLPA